MIHETDPSPLDRAIEMAATLLLGLYVWAVLIIIMI